MLNKNKLRKLKESRINFLSDSSLEMELKKMKKFEDIKSSINNFVFNKNLVLYAFRCDHVC